MGVHQLVSCGLPPSGIRVRLVKLGKGAKKLSKRQIVEILQLLDCCQSFQFVTKNLVNLVGEYLQLGNGHQHILDLEEKFMKSLEQLSFSILIKTICLTLAMRNFDTVTIVKNVIFVIIWIH